MTMNRNRHVPRLAANIECWTVGRPDAGKSLMDHLASRRKLSRRAAKALIDSRSVWVNRQCVWIAHHALKTGDLVEVPNGLGGLKGVKGFKDVNGVKGHNETKVHIRVLSETKDFVVADKPAGLLSNGGPGTVEAILREQLGEPNLQAVHRLDRDTSGCLLFARSYAAYLAAVDVFKTRRVRKEYRAVVAGKFPYAHQRIDTPLDGQPAVSHVLREVAAPDASFLKVRIETGRTNQIRRHLASVRFPIVGDRTFGLKHARDPRLMAVPRQMLHASSLELPDPVAKGATIRAHSPLPADFRAALKLFGMGRR
jgi:23S rRNA pseudouridine1911/1915/1917 synthase